MAEQAERARLFEQLHRDERPLLLPNPWDRGSAKLLASLGFRALATTSSGSAATLGELDGALGRERALALAAAIVSATDLPVSADLENGFAADATGVAETVRLAIEAGLAGCSIEDSSGNRDAPIYELAEAADRVAAAAESAHGAAGALVLTARAENHLHGRPDLDDTIARLQAYEQAGADVLYAPGLTELADIARLVESVGLPVNVLARPGVPQVSELASVGVARVSVGGGFAFAALGALVEAGTELREHGTYGFWEHARVGAKAAQQALGDASDRERG
jgi:2-methylisocitrate lyase-like PEP mutase family enzyme